MQGMRARLCVFSAFLGAGCSTTSPQAGPATLPPTSASVAEVQSYEAGKEAAALAASYPAWTYPAGIAAKIGAEAVQAFTH